MKVLILNGSPRKDGNTSIACVELEKTFVEEGIEVEIVNVGTSDVRGCVACGSCGSTGKCVFDDLVNEVSEKLDQADGLILASPVYYASANSTLTALCDRLFYSNHTNKCMKVGASVAIARRGGTSATFDQLNKYFTISNMPVVSSSYWNLLHGGAKGDVAQDGEGLHTLRVLARNMAFLMKSIALGKEQFGLPEIEQKVWTNFIR